MLRKKYLPTPYIGLPKISASSLPLRSTREADRQVFFAEHGRKLGEVAQHAEGDWGGVITSGYKLKVSQAF
jgi:hypothetical protein